MKARIKSLLRESGLYAFTYDSLPTGIDWLIDIRRGGILGSAPVFLDVGANVGQTVTELRLRWPDARIHAFEPFASPRAALELAVKGDAKTTVVPLAMGATPGRVSIRPAHDSLQSSLQPDDDGPGRQHDGAPPDSHRRPPPEAIEVDTLDAYCARTGVTHVDILKTDTEGYDLEVLKGATGLLSRGQVTYVMVEVGLQAEDRQHTPLHSAMALLTGHGMRLLGLYETYPLHFYPDPFTFCNALFVAAKPRHKAALQRRGQFESE